MPLLEIRGVFVVKGNSATRFKTKKMKTTLKLENIETTGSGVEFANIICELSENQYLDKETITVNLSCTSIAVRIMSDHLVGEMKHICENLDTDKIREFVKDMLKAKKTLKEVRSM